MVQQKIDISSIDTSRSYTVKEVATMVQYTQVYLRDLIRAKKIKGFKPMGGNGNIRIPGEEVKRLLASVQEGTGLTATPSADDVDQIDVSPELSQKLMPGGVADPEPTTDDQDDGDGGAFRHLIEVK